MKQFTDLTGKKFNRLTVIERAENNKEGRICWKCRCDCGKETIVLGKYLLNNNTKSCGCLKIEKSKGRLIDLTGKKFGRLTVIERAENNKRGQTFWKCKCDCGKETIVNSVSLRSGDTQSCGCYLKERISKSFGEASFNHILREYKGQAKKGNKEFSLSDDEFKELIYSNCYYCGKEPSQVMRSRSSNGNILYNGIDRIDNSKGYVRGNVVPCCRQCNIAKRDHTVKEFKAWIKAIYEHLNLREKYD